MSLAKGQWARLVNFNRLTNILWLLNLLVVSDKQAQCPFVSIFPIFSWEGLSPSPLPFRAHVRDGVRRAKCPPRPRTKDAGLMSVPERICWLVGLSPSSPGWIREDCGPQLMVNFHLWLRFSSGLWPRRVFTHLTLVAKQGIWGPWLIFMPF